MHQLFLFILLTLPVAAMTAAAGPASSSAAVSATEDCGRIFQRKSVDSSCRQLKAIYHEPGSFSRAFGPAFITGASVSDDWNGVKSPGRKVLESMGARFTKGAYPWASSDEILDLIKEKPPAAGTKTLIAIDLFFWDPELGEEAACKPGYVDSVIHELRKYSSRLILAKIPVLLAQGDADCVSLINEELEESCVAGNHCYLAPEPDFGGGANPARYFQADRLHLSDAGSSLAAESICSTFLRMPSR